MNPIRPLLPAAILIPLATACGHQTLKPAEPSTSYFQDARQCHSETQQTIKLKINPAGALGSKYHSAHIGGGVADVPIPLGHDPNHYRACMEERGWKTDPSKDPYIAAIDTCRKSAEILATATAANKGAVRIGGDLDASAYEECLRNQGIDGTVIVHPIEPVPSQ